MRPFDQRGYEEMTARVMTSLNRFRISGLWLMFLPCFLYFVIFHYFPMVGIVLAFKDYVMVDGFFGSSWVGLQNFDRLFASADFLRALRNTIVISFFRLGLGFVAPIVLALLLNEVRWTGFKKWVQVVTYIPYLLSWVILGGIFLLIFSIDGPVNRLLLYLADLKIGFLTDDHWFIFILIVTHIWQSAGYGAVIYLAALSGISPTLYEAATVDGANRWQLVWHITIPALTPTIIVLLILNLGLILDVGFDQIYNMYNPLVYDVADIVDTYVLRHLMTLDIGLATAAGVFKSVVGLFMVVAANLIANRLSGGEQGIL